MDGCERNRASSSSADFGSISSWTEPFGTKLMALPHSHMIWECGKAVKSRVQRAVREEFAPKCDAVDVTPTTVNALQMSGGRSRWRLTRPGEW